MHEIHLNPCNAHKFANYQKNKSFMTLPNQVPKLNQAPSISETKLHTEDCLHYTTAHTHTKTSKQTETNKRTKNRGHNMNTYSFRQMLLSNMDSLLHVRSIWTCVNFIWTQEIKAVLFHSWFCLFLLGNIVLWLKDTVHSIMFVAAVTKSTEMDEYRVTLYKTMKKNGILNTMSEEF